MLKFYIIATPIGNLEDITLRALNTLKTLDFVVVETTERTRKLLSHYKIELEIYSLKSDVIALLKKGKQGALLSDAGTPLISDPGFELITKLKNNNVKIIPIPGPSAIITALMASSISIDKFIFLGFLPKSESKKKDLLITCSSLGIPLVVFEAPQRIEKTLENIKSVFPSCFIFVAREMTKIYEEYYELTQKTPLTAKGEFTLIIQPNTKNLQPISLAKAIQSTAFLNKASASKVLSLIYNMPKKTVYDLLLKK